MDINEGAADRVIRAMAGTVLIGMAYFGAIGAWGYVGLVPLATAVAGYCPLYRLAGLNTCAMTRP